MKDIAAVVTKISMAEISMAETSYIVAVCPLLDEYRNLQA